MAQKRVLLAKSAKPSKALPTSTALAPTSISINNDARPRGRPPERIARTSQPGWMTPAIANGFGFIPRRGSSEFGEGGNALRSIDQILSIARTQPLYVLTLLPDIIPEVGKAVWNGMRLGCGPTAVRIKAMKRSASGTDVQEAPDGTEAIKNLWKVLPQEIGDFTSLLQQNFLQSMFTGMCAVEAVPGPRGTGIAEIWPIDTLSLQLRRDTKTRLISVWQRQRVYGGIGIDMGAIRQAYSGFIPMPMGRFFWRALDGFPDDPYGRAPMSTALNPVLEMVMFMKDLLTAWHRVGTPKWDIGFDYEMWARIAREQIGLTEKEEIEEYVRAEFDYAVALFRSMQPDDALWHDINSKVSVNGSGGAWPDVGVIFDILRWRIIMGLKEMPTLMGVVEGNTETWSSVDWQIYAKGLEAMVHNSAFPLIKVAQLHLQLLGMPYTVEAEYEPIRANQRMVDAQSAQLEGQNEAFSRDQGWQSNDDASLKITGSAAIAEPNKDMLGLNKPQNGMPGNGAGGSTGSSAANKSKSSKKSGTKGPSKAT